MNTSSGRLGMLPAIRLTCEWKCALIRPGIAIRPAASMTSAPGAGKIRSDSGDRRALDQDIGPGMLRVRRIQREDSAHRG